MRSEKIMDRIRKLMALSESSSQEEASLAAQKATELMLRHHITESMLDSTKADTEDVVDLPVFLGCPASLRMDFYQFLHALASCFDVTAFFHSRPGSRSHSRAMDVRVTLVGFREDAATVSLLYSRLEPVILVGMVACWQRVRESQIQMVEDAFLSQSWVTASMRDSWRDQLQRSTEGKTSVIRGYVTGFGIAVVHRVASAREKVIDESVHPGELVLQDRGAHVESWIRDNLHTNLRDVSMADRDPSAVAAGERDGIRADIGIPRIGRADT